MSADEKIRQGNFIFDLISRLLAGLEVASKGVGACRCDFRFEIEKMQAHLSQTVLDRFRVVVADASSAKISGLIAAPSFARASAKVSRDQT